MNQKRIPRILVPIDFSESCVNAIRFAYAVAKKREWGLALVHIYPTAPQERKVEVPLQFRDYDRGIRKLMADFATEYLGALPKSTLLIARGGTPWVKISNISKAYALIVMAAKPYKSGIHRLVGSRTSRIALNSNCPVLIIPANTPIEYTGFKDVWVLGRREEDREISEAVLKKIGLEKAKINLNDFPGLRVLPSLWDRFMPKFFAKDSELEKVIGDYLKERNIDLIILINYHQGNLAKFLNDETKQIVFKYNLPALICQAKNVFPEKIQSTPGAPMSEG